MNGIAEAFNNNRNGEDRFSLNDYYSLFNAMVGFVLAAEMD